MSPVGEGGGGEEGDGGVRTHPHAAAPRGGRALHDAGEGRHQGERDAAMVMTRDAAAMTSDAALTRDAAMTQETRHGKDLGHGDDTAAMTRPR